MGPWPLRLGLNQLGEVLVGHDATPVRHAVRRIALWWTAGLLLAVGALLYLSRRRLTAESSAVAQVLRERDEAGPARDSRWG